MWTYHLIATKINITRLQLDVALSVSSDDMAALITTMRQLKVLRVGQELNPVLGRDVVGAIPVIPSLKDLKGSLTDPIVFVGFMATKTASKILPE